MVQFSLYVVTSVFVWFCVMSDDVKKRIKIINTTTKMTTITTLENLQQKIKYIYIFFVLGIFKKKFSRPRHSKGLLYKYLCN